MKIPEPIVMMASGGVTSIAGLYLQQSVEVMTPWLMATFAVIIADLVAGIRKSHLLGVHVSPSTAFRETMGKVVVYFAFVMTAALVDVAAQGNLKIAKWCCLFIMTVEGGSVASNILKPSGVTISLKGLLKLLLKRSPLGIGDEEADEIIKTARREDRKWNSRKYSGDRNIDKRPKNVILDDNNDGKYEDNTVTANSGDTEHRQGEA